MDKDNLQRGLLIKRIIYQVEHLPRERKPLTRTQLMFHKWKGNQNSNTAQCALLCFDGTLVRVDNILAYCQTQTRATCGTVFAIFQADTNAQKSYQTHFPVLMAKYLAHTNAAVRVLATLSIPLGRAYRCS